MHDQQPHARVHEPSSAHLIDNYELELEICFRGETYRVRDNGAVYRIVHPRGRRRRLDELWTFGNANTSTGYMTINRHVIHQIVATAFHGPKPSDDYVCDHIDTNRMNNRADNLRWVTRLENVLLNPITRQRVIGAYGSLDAFLDNPKKGTVPNLEWMRTVSKEEALECKNRLTKWAENPGTPRGGKLGEWLFESASAQLSQPKEPEDISTGHPFFGELWNRDVEFYDPKRKSRPQVGRAFFAMVRAISEQDGYPELQDGYPPLVEGPA